MRRFLALALLLAPFTPAKMPLDEFRTRRANLRKSLDGVVLLVARTEARDEVFRVDQEPNFYYLTGWTDPGARLLVTPSREILFLPHHDERREHYMGKRASAEDSDVHAITGFEEVLPIEKFEAELDQALSAHEKVYTLANTAFADKLKSLYPFRDMSDAAPVIAKLRMKKSAAEVAAIQRAPDVSVEAHRADWKRMGSGIYEYQLEATLVDTFLQNGCEGVSYAPIVGSGPNSTVLHYSSNHRRADRGEVVVIDSAAQ